MKKLILIDGNSLLFRAFYALPLLSNPEGAYTNAVYGFAVMLKKLLQEEQPTHVLVAFDKARRTFRNDIFAEYKGTRKDTPQELVGQFALVREFLQLRGIVWLEQEGYEADDLIGVYSKAAEEQEIPCIIVTGDRDALQLVSPQTQVFLTKKGIGEMEHYAPEDVEQKLGVRVDQVVDLKALMGDSSDNIPGVPGVGPKTAAKLIVEYGSLQGLYENLEAVKAKKLHENLEKYQEQAWMSQKLARIVRDIPLPVPLEELTFQPVNTEALASFYRRMQFKKFLAELEQETAAKEAPESLFAEEEETENSTVQEISSAEAWTAFLARHPAAKAFGLRVLGDHSHPMLAKLQSVWVEAEGEAVRVDKGLLEGPLRCWLEDEKVPKILHDVKYAQVLLLRHLVELRGVTGDLMLLTYVLDPVFQGEKLETALAFHQQKVQEADDVSLILALRPTYEVAWEALSETMKKLLDEMEIPTALILGKMEFCGIRLDPWVLKDIGHELEGRILERQEDIYTLAGEVFNILSPKQLGKVLFEDLGLPAGKKTKSGYSTGAEVLEKLQEDYPIAGAILDYRKLTKLKSTYIEALPQMVHPQTGRIHTLFRQALTATGRLSSIEPNLQNIPVRMEEGRRIRKAFVPGKPDWVFLSADYSQIDLRALAHISEDENLIQTFRDEVDIHTRTASEIFGVAPQEVTEELRRRAKAVNFGIIYGISDYGLARDTGVSRKEAGQYIQAYLQSYPGVQKYMETVVEEGREKGYVETAFGRRRYIPELRAKNHMVQANARRIALNTPIQGTSADIIKLAMLKTDAAAKACGLRTHLLLQVHDELLFEVHREDLEAWAEQVKDCMENACRLKVPLEVTLKWGENWYEMQRLAWEK